MARDAGAMLTSTCYVEFLLPSVLLPAVVLRDHDP